MFVRGIQGNMDLQSRPQLVEGGSVQGLDLGSMFCTAPFCSLVLGNANLIAADSVDSEPLQSD